MVYQAGTGLIKGNTKAAWTCHVIWGLKGSLTSLAQQGHGVGGSGSRRDEGGLLLSARRVGGGCVGHGDISSFHDGVVRVRVEVPLQGSGAIMSRGGGMGRHVGGERVGG